MGVVTFDEVAIVAVHRSQYVAHGFGGAGFKHGVQFAGLLNQGKYQVFDSLNRDALRTRGWQRAALVPSSQWFHHGTLPIF
jgi:hypothetical protein